MKTTDSTDLCQMERKTNILNHKLIEYFTNNVMYTTSKYPKRT